MTFSKPFTSIFYKLSSEFSVAIEDFENITNRAKNYKTKTA